MIEAVFQNLPGSISLNIRDIAERRRAEEALRKSETWYRAVVATVPDAILTITTEGVIQSFNRAAERIFGYRAEEVVGKSLQMLIPELLRGPHEPSFHRWLRAGEADAATKEFVELVGLRKNGEEISVEISFGEMREGDGVMYAVVVRDILERKRVEYRLQAEAARLRQRNRELQDFVWTASQEVQVPLRKIKSFGVLLRTKYAQALGHKGLDYLERMEGAAARTQELIDGLLALLRLTPQSRPFEPVNLAEVAKEVVSDLGRYIEQLGGHVEVGKLPTVEADRGQMRQLVQNLIDNGLKFHKEGEAPVVKVYGGHSEDLQDLYPDPAGGKVYILVEDNGIGFDEKYLEKIFAPFRRLHSNAAYEGTGMGLAICRRVAKYHGGEITARSAPGQGARFIVTLPIKQPEATLDQATTPEVKEPD